MNLHTQLANPVSFRVIEIEEIQSGEFNLSCHAANSHPNFELITPLLKMIPAALIDIISPNAS
jgi:hypothetical protein